MKKVIGAAAAALVAAGGAAQAAVYNWTWDGSVFSVGVGGTGASQAIAANGSFDTATEVLSWSITFAAQDAGGIWAVINNGPYPGPFAGRDAILYMDGTGSDVKINIFGYNASGDQQTSHLDGDAMQAGDQAPDRILNGSTAAAPSWLIDAAVLDNANGSRTFDFTIDTTDVNAHNPLYAPANEWRGLGFAQTMGVWIHSVTELQTAYDNDGWLTDWTFETQSFFDEPDINVPTPGAVALLGLGGLVAGRRRR
jgi:hypothetical protein